MPPTKANNTRGIVSLDPANPIQEEIKPLIADILRTKYCIQGSVFLVEGIDLVTVGGERGRGGKMIRLLLGDGELVIQGFVRGVMHWVVEGGKVFEGGYVRLDKFDLVEVEGEGEGEGEGGKEGVLVIGDLKGVGWDEGYLGVLRGEGREVKDVGGLVRREGEGRKLFGLERRAREMEERKRREREEEERRREEEEEQRRREEEKKEEEDKVVERDRQAVEREREEEEKKEEDEDYISESDYDDEGFERMVISTERATQRRAMAAAHTSTTINNLTTPQRPPPFKQQPIQHPQVLLPPPSRKILTPKTPQPRPPVKIQENTTPKSLPWQANDPTRPLKLTPLSQIPYLPYKQNWMINALVVVTQLGETEPCPYPPYVQRQARVIDQSTAHKHIHLTVFLEPDDFEPKLGEVYLLLGVKNHKFDGGSLKKYASDKPKWGGRWWVEGRGLGWCKGMVEELENWWAVEQQGGGGDFGDEG
ncbi:hypothetical protein QBC41DRAFT_390494 [Cercophora samala]|uniref:Uncharacterized protein n=1 Tax=Cercophora samala TaxID=330535 RepID=A0AA39ZFE4_9PEZI|nr:hypothetical protein QBC41DRAFT_390494 [Cercophora samala]